MIVKQFGRFAVVGLVATLVHVAVVVVLVEAAGSAPLLANAIAFALALAVSYAGNHQWTFRARGNHRRHFPRFATTAGLGLLLNQTIMYVMIEGLGQDYRVALALVVLVVPLLSFLLNRLWSFSAEDSTRTMAAAKRRSQEPRPPDPGDNQNKHAS
jgi:putative flippase GtrA